MCSVDQRQSRNFGGHIVIIFSHVPTTPSRDAQMARQLSAFKNGPSMSASNILPSDLRAIVAYPLSNFGWLPFGKRKTDNAEPRKLGDTPALSTVTAVSYDSYRIFASPDFFIRNLASAHRTPEGLCTAQICP
jgi:hypothetical protein